MGIRDGGQSPVGAAVDLCFGIQDVGDRSDGQGHAVLLDHPFALGRLFWGQMVEHLQGAIGIAAQGTHSGSNHGPVHYRLQGQ